MCSIHLIEHASSPLISHTTRCLDLETHHSTVKKVGKPMVLICARFLGYMLIEAPVDAGREGFASEVARCIDDEALQAQAELYKNHFLRVRSLCRQLDSEVNNRFSS
jgi:hypothetical protein